MENDKRRVLVVAAHPDDIEYTVAGTVARWTSDGQEVIYVLVTDGNAGAADPGVTREQIGALRRAEQHAAAAAVGVREVVFLGYDDAILEPTLALRRDLARVIRRYRPDAVVCQDSSAYWLGPDYLNHPDHRAAGNACLAAIFPAAGTRLAFPELLAEGWRPHCVREVYLTMTSTPDLWLDIEATLDRKLAAWAENHSQISVTGLVEQRIIEAARACAEGHPGMTYAEPFKHLRLS